MAPGITLTGVGAVLLMALAAVFGAVIDVLTGPTLGLVTAVLLTAGAVIGCWLVRRRNLFTVVLAPPLVYLALALCTLAVLPSLALSATSVAATLVYGFPAMAAATLAAVLIAAIRLLSRR